MINITASKFAVITNALQQNSSTKYDGLYILSYMAQLATSPDLSGTDASKNLYKAMQANDSTIKAAINSLSAQGYSTKMFSDPIEAFYHTQQPQTGAQTLQQTPRSNAIPLPPAAGSSLFKAPK